MCKILFLLSLIMISCVKESAQSIPNEHKLKKNVESIFECIIDKNVEKLITFFPDREEVEVSEDYYLPKSKIAEDLYSKGRIYSYLFNSEKYYELNKSFLKQFDSDSDVNISISDVFTKAKKMGVSFKYNPIELNGKIEVVHVYVNWKGKKEFKKNWYYFFTFMPIENDWKLVSLNVRH